MELAQIYENLCWYDRRHPDFFDQGEDQRPAREPGCSCDSCFYGSDRLAMEILRLRERWESSVEWPS